MAQSKCLGCGGTRFEMKELDPTAGPSSSTWRFNARRAEG